MSIARRWLRDSLEVREGERLPTALLFGWGFLALTSFYVLKPVRNAVFLDRVGADGLPLVYVVTAAVVAGASLLYSRYASHLRRRTLLTGTLAFLVGSLIVFWWILREGGAGPWSSGAFYVFTKIYPLLLVSQFWLAANTLFTTGQARRLFAPLGTGLLLGGVAGSALAGLLAHRLESAELPLVAAAILVICGVLVSALGPDVGDAGRLAHLSDEAGWKDRGRVGAEPAGAVRTLLESSHLRTLAALLGVTVVVGTLLDWQLNRAVELSLEGEAAKTRFFGVFYGVLGLLSVAIQLLVTGIVLRRLGLRVSLLVLPVTLAVATAGIVVLPALAAAAVAKGAEGALRNSLDQSSRELLFLPVPQAVKRRVKPLIDVAVYRGGTGLAGLALLGVVNGLDLEIRAVALLTLAVTVVWILTAVRMRHEFTESLRALIGVQDVKLEELIVGRLNAETRQEIGQVLRGGSTQEIEYALALLELDLGPGLEDEIGRLLQHPAPAVRSRAVDLLSRVGADEWAGEVERLLDDPSIDVRSEAIQYLCRVEGVDGDARFTRFLEDENPEIRAAATGCLLRHGGEASREVGLDRIAELVGEGGPDDRRRAAQLLGSVDDPPPRAVDLLADLLDDPEVEVRRDALGAAGRAGMREYVPVMLERLHDPEQRADAAAALRSLGPDVHPDLMDALESGDSPPDVRTILPGLVLPDPSPRTLERLVGLLPEAPPVLRYEILKTLNKLRRREPERRMPPVDERGLVERELEAAHRFWLLARALEVERPARAHLLARTLEQRRLESVERALRTLALSHPPGTLYAAFEGLRASKDRATRESGYELLDSVLPQEYRAPFATAVNPDLTPDQREEDGRDRFGLEPPEAGSALERLGEIGDPWLALLAARCESEAAALDPRDLESRLRAEGLLLTSSLPRSPETLMRFVNRAERLSQTTMFEDLRTEDLVGIATLTEEEEWEEGDVLFEEGQAGGTLHVVVEGRIEARKGERLLFSAGPGGTVGALSLLDGRPTGYEARATEPTVTLSLDREAFREALVNREAVVTGVVQYLTGVIRGLNEAPETED